MRVGGDEAVDEQTSVGRNQITAHLCENTINLTIDSSASRPTLPWRSPTARLALALIPGGLTLALLSFNVGWPIKTIVGAVLAMSAVSPVAGFLAIVAIAPFGHLLALAVSVENFRVTEAVVLAFFSGWLLHGWTDRAGPRAPRFVVPCLIALVAASVVGVAWQTWQQPGEMMRDLSLLTHAYNLIEDRIGVVAGARLVEGLVMALATVTLFRSRPRLAVLVPVLLAIGGVVTAGASWLLWYGVAPAQVLREHARNGYRVAAYVTDANAAGSAFAMVTCLSLGMAWRARGWSRTIWLAAAAATASGVWLSVSRSALGALAVSVVLLVFWRAAVRLGSRHRALVAAAVTVAALAGSVYLWRMSREQLTRGSSLRQQFNRTSARMIEARPLVGVGIGRYYTQSAMFMSPELAWFYGSENAHNYFLQIAAELGVPGLALFAGLFTIGLWRAGRGAAARPDDARLMGVSAGALAFLITAFVSHPFLVDEVALPFWVQFGLMLGLAGAAQHRSSLLENARRAGNAPLAVGLAAAICVVALPVLRVWRGEIEPPADAAVDGFYGWETAADGARYRWSREYASVFAPAGSVYAAIPVRIPYGARGLPMVSVTPSIDGAHRAPVPVGDAWSLVEVNLPPALDPTKPRRIDLRVEPTWEPALYIAGDADMRRVGVQVGESRFGR